MKEKLITTIITTYKRSDTLPRAIKSVLNQTYKNIEIIVVDDNDSDSIYRKETIKIMQGFANNPVIKYICHPKNLNGANARNTGLQVAKGDFITFLDDDDEYVSNRFEKLIPILDNSPNNVGAIFSAFNQYKNNNLYRMRKLSFSNDVINELLSDKFMIGSGSNFILKREVISKVVGFDPKFIRHQDFEFLVRVAEKFDFIVYNQGLINLYDEDVHSNKISIDKLIMTKKEYLKKYQYLVNERDKKTIENSQLESLLFSIYSSNQESDYNNIIKYYKKNNDNFKSLLILFKIKSYAKIRNLVKKIQSSP